MGEGGGAKGEQEIPAGVELMRAPAPGALGEALHCRAPGAPGGHERGGEEALGTTEGVGGERGLGFQFG